MLENSSVEHGAIEHEDPELSWFDLVQIRHALHELRSSNPKSVLAELGEEKIQALESNHAIRSDLRSMPRDRDL